MAASFRPGMRVSTPYGPGEVVAMDGRQVKVHLPAIGLMIRFDPDVLTAEGPPRPHARTPRASQPLAASDDGLVRRAVDALRFGIVPWSAIERVTVGFDELEHWTTSRLPTEGAGAPLISEVCGPFGTGKSHTMAVIRSIAHNKGFLTAHVEVNGQGVTLADPAGLLFHLWSTLTGPDLESITPLIELNVRAALRGASSAATSLSRFERVYANHETVRLLRNNGALEEFEERLDALMTCNDQESASSLRYDMLVELRARGMSHFDARNVARPTRLIGWGVDERPGHFVDCLFGYAALARSAGFAGLVVTIDEFEIEYVVPGERLGRVRDLIAVLAKRLGRSQMGGVPLAVFIATVGQEGALGDGIVESLLNQTPGDQEDKRRALRPWPAKHLRMLGRKIHELYREAYKVEGRFDAEAADQLVAKSAADEDDRSGQVRAFIKGYVAELDARYGPPAT